MSRFTVRVPVYAEAIFDEIESDDEASAIAEVLERIEDNGVVEAADYLEEHSILGKNSENQLTESIAELESEETESAVLED